MSVNHVELSPPVVTNDVTSAPSAAEFAVDGHEKHDHDNRDHALAHIIREAV